MGSMRRPLQTALLALLAVVLVVVGGLWAMQRKIIYQPDTQPPPAAASVIDGASDLTLTTDDGLELTAWFVPPVPEADRGLAVLFAPGNGGNRFGRAEFARLLADRGFTVLLMDYRGYGGNPGSPSEDGTAQDARAALDALRGKGFEPDRIIYFGESLGGGVVTRLQLEVSPAAIVLRSPFSSLPDVASSHFPWLPVRWLLREDYPVVENVRQAQVPITVIYGDHDTIVPTELSQQVAAAVPQLFEELELPGDHNDAIMVGSQVADAVVRIAEATVS